MNCAAEKSSWSTCCCKNADHNEPVHDTDKKRRVDQSYEDNSYRNAFVRSDNVIPNKQVKVIKVILSGFIIGVVLHIIMSLIWGLGFAISMGNAFSPGSSAINGEFFLVCHNLFYFPIIIAEYNGIHLAPGAEIKEDFLSTLQFTGIGPLPCLATIFWCTIVGTFIFFIVLRFKGLKKEDALE